MFQKIAWFVKLFGVHASEFSRLLHFYGERMKQNYIVKKSYFGQDFTSLPLSNFKCFSLVFIKIRFIVIGCDR